MIGIFTYCGLPGRKGFYVFASDGLAFLVEECKYRVINVTRCIIFMPPFCELTLKLHLHIFKTTSWESNCTIWSVWENC
jgi:hypothetical protein